MLGLQQGLIFVLGLLAGALIMGLLEGFLEHRRRARGAEGPDLAAEEHGRLAAIVESSEDAIIGKTLTGIVTSWNAGAERIYGWRAEEIIGRSIALIVPPDRPEELPGILARLKKGERVDRFRTERICKDGRRIPVSVIISPIRDARGRIVGASTISHDITERMEFEARLREQSERLADADRHKDEFLAILGHELRNPLAPIRYAVQMLVLVGPPNPALQRQREVIERQVAYMTRLIDDLLDVSRISSGKIQLKWELVDLRLVADRAIETLQGQIQERRHYLDYQRGSEAIWVKADTTRLEQVTRNLLTNAIKYTEPGGRITLSLGQDRQQQDAGQAWLRIKDTGIGIAPEMLGRIFDLFTQADRALDHAQGGLGIGLTLVRRLITLHGGQIQAFSPGAGQGSEFRVTLPLAAAGATASQEPVAAAGATAMEHAAAAHGTPRRVLIVDDNVDSATTLADVLTRWSHQVQVAYDGRRGLALALAAPPPDLVLLNIGLPELDGYEVARRIRQQQQGAGILLVALTGYGQEEDRVRAREAGFDDHFTKPIGMEALARLLGRATERTREAA